MRQQSLKPLLLLVVGVLSLAVMLNAYESKPKFTYPELGRYDSKLATKEEAQEILNLIGIEKQMLEWK